MHPLLCHDGHSSCYHVLYCVVAMTVVACASFPFMFFSSFLSEHPFHLHLHVLFVGGVNLVKSGADGHSVEVDGGANLRVEREVALHQRQACCECGAHALIEKRSESEGIRQARLVSVNSGSIAVGEESCGSHIHPRFAIGLFPSHVSANRKTCFC